MKSPCIFDAARRDLDQKRFSSGIDLPCGKNTAALIHSLKKKNRLARSARTRRSVRSRRVELSRESARAVCNFGVVEYGVFGKMPQVRCRDDSVKHGASPSRRDKSLRVNMSPVIQLQSAAAEHRDVQRRYAASLSPFSPNRVELVQPLCRPPRSIRCLGPVASFPSCTPGIQTQNNCSHIAMSYQPSIAWKASLRAHRRRFARPPSVLKPRWS